MPIDFELAVVYDISFIQTKSAFLFVDKQLCVYERESHVFYHFSVFLTYNGR